MLCGQIHLVSRIKHLLFFSFSNKYRPFEKYKCHSCLWCTYFNDCKEEHANMQMWDKIAELNKDQINNLCFQMNKQAFHAASCSTCGYRKTCPHTWVSDNEVYY